MSNTLAIIVAVAAVSWTTTVQPTAHAFHLPFHRNLQQQQQPLHLPSPSLSSTNTLHRQNRSQLSNPISTKPPSSCSPFSTTSNIQPLFAKTDTNNYKNIASEPAVEISFPTPTESISLGIQQWPQQFHSSNWNESIIEGQIATRYILSGSGRLSITYYNNDDPGGQVQTMNNVRIYPGTLIEVNGEATLQWTIDDKKEGMIVLTPTYEEGGKLLVVMAGMVLFCLGLLIGSSTGGL
ncbi:hypothetical protein ACHAXH_004847 [Discostella pseudostelligera]